MHVMALHPSNTHGHQEFCSLDFLPFMHVCVHGNQYCIFLLFLQLPESSRDRDLRELIARRRKEKKTHTPHPKTEMVLTADREEESQEGGGMASVVKLVER